MQNQIYNEWWRGATIYQIYPRSFLDTRGDGTGDLPGVIEKLDYVANLGVDAIWLSPFFTSPMKDFGYDISDFCDVDAVFGTLEDFDELVAKAHSLGLRVIIDQVLSHTSDEHAWFRESREDRDNRKADWYVWANAKEDGSPPNNWQSIFWGAAWTWCTRRNQYYLHNFLAGQPDLNLHNNEVQNALLNVLRFWLDRGVDGFRLDAINFGMHDVLLRDNPPASAPYRVENRPNGMQVQKYNSSHPDMPRFLERIRKLTDSFGEIFTVAEVAAPNPFDTMKEYTRGNRRLNTAYSFDFLHASELNAGTVEALMSSWSDDPDAGWPSWAFSNHDASRVASRWGQDIELKQRAKLVALLQMCLRGNLFVYQGEELGLQQSDVPYERLRDPEAIANWPHTFGRDGARTPMPWLSEAPYAGFSNVEPWLPVDESHLPLAVDRGYADSESVLNSYREFIEIRRLSPALRTGVLEIIEAPDGILAFVRRNSEETVYCVFNLGVKPVAWQPEVSCDLKVKAAVGFESQACLVPDQLGRYQGYIGIRVE